MGNLFKVALVVIGLFVFGFLVGKAYYANSDKKEIVKLDTERLRLSIKKLELELNKE